MAPNQWRIHQEIFHIWTSTRLTAVVHEEVPFHSRSCRSRKLTTSACNKKSVFGAARIPGIHRGFTAALRGWSWDWRETCRAAASSQTWVAIRQNSHTVDGWNPQLTGSLSPLFTWFYTSQVVVWDFFHQPYICITCIHQSFWPLTSKDTAVARPRRSSSIVTTVMGVVLKFKRPWKERGKPSESIRGPCCRRSDPSSSRPNLIEISHFSWIAFLSCFGSFLWNRHFYNLKKKSGQTSFSLSMPSIAQKKRLQDSQPSIARSDGCSSNCSWAWPSILASCEVVFSYTSIAARGGGRSFKKVKYRNQKNMCL